MIVYEDVFTFKNKVYIREFNTDTKEVIFKKESVVPRLFVKGDGEYKSFIGEFPLKEVKNKTFSEFKTALSSYKKSDIITYGRKNPAFEYIFNNYPNPLECVHQFRTWYLDIEVTGEIDKSCKNPKIAWKPELANQEITLIQYYDSYDKKYYVLGLKDLEKPLEVTEKEIKYIKFSSEENLLKGFLKLIEYRKPSIIIGWNTFGYDFPYLTNRIARVLDGFKGDILQEDGAIAEEVLLGGYVKSLSPFGIVEADYKVINSSEEFSPNWKGIILEDYLHLYKKYTFVELSSFSLNSVCSHELGDEKVDHDEYSDFMEFYQKDFQKFCEYGVKDVELLVKLDEKLKLLMLVQYISYMTGVCIPDIRGTLKQWSNYVYNEAFKQNIVVPTENIYSGQSEVKFIGGVVHSTSERWNWVASLDFTSLYPSIISNFNIGADTWVSPNKELSELKEKYFLTYAKDEEPEEVKKKHIDFCNNILFNDKIREEIHSTLEKYNVTATPNGQFFRKDKRSLIAVLLDNLLVERKRYKKLMKEAEQKVEELKAKNEDYSDWKSKAEGYEVTQVALKVLANSLYGILSMASNPFAGHPEYFSNSVTSSGQIADISCAIASNNLIKQVNSKLSTPLKGKGTLGLDWIAQKDTDSVVGDTEIIVNNQRISIEDYFNSKCKDKTSERLVIPVKGDVSLSVNDKLEKENKNIKYVMRHKTTKRLFKIKVNGKEVILTEDESMVVLRDGKLERVKPTELRKGDGIITND